MRLIFFFKQKKAASNTRRRPRARPPRPTATLAASLQFLFLNTTSRNKNQIYNHGSQSEARQTPLLELRWPLHSHAT
jgi:hypothetical protein